MWIALILIISPVEMSSNNILGDAWQSTILYDIVPAIIRMRQKFAATLSLCRFLKGNLTAKRF